MKPPSTEPPPVTEQPAVPARDITPQQFGAIGDGISHPLSEKYASLTEAKAVYSFATSLNDELDWCAIQQAINIMAADNPGKDAGQNWAGGTLYFPAGVYVVNREIFCSLYNPYIYADKAGAPELINNPTKIVWNGPPGTIDEPKYIFKFWTIDPATGLPPPGILPQPRGVRLTMSGVGFEALSHIPTQTPGYVSAAIVGYGGFLKITDCNFGTVYDGIVIAGAQLFVNIERNHFYGVYRDGFSQLAVKGNFTTCLWIRDNEFGYYGRYAIAINSRGVELHHDISTNSIEGAVDNSFYYRNQAHFFQGVKADVLLHQLNGVFDKNRFESPAYTHNVHVVSDVQSTFSNNAMSETSEGAAFGLSSIGQSNGSAEFQAYLDSHGYSDITDKRNYTFAEDSVTNAGMIFFGNTIHKIFMWKYGNASLSNQTDFSCAMQGNTRTFLVPVTPGTIQCDISAKEEQTNAYNQSLAVTMNAQRGRFYQALEVDYDKQSVAIGAEAFGKFGGGLGVLSLGYAGRVPTEPAHNAIIFWADRSDSKVRMMKPDGTIVVLG